MMFTVDQSCSMFTKHAALNAIVFGSAPEPDAVIEVSFRHICQP